MYLCDATRVCSPSITVSENERNLSKFLIPVTGYWPFLLVSDFQSMWRKVQEQNLPPAIYFGKVREAFISRTHMAWENAGYQLTVDIRYCSNVLYSKTECTDEIQHHYVLFRETCITSLL